MNNISIKNNATTQQSTETRQTISQLIKEATTLSQTKQYKKTLEIFNKILSLEPQNIDALLAKGQIWFHLKKYHKAENLFKKILSFKPEHPEAMEGYAKAKFFQSRSSQIDDAFYQTTLAAEKESTILLNHLKASMKNENYDEVNDWIDAFFKDNSERISLLLDYATGLYKSRQFAHSECILKKIAEIDPKNNQALIAYANCLVKLKKYEDAERIFQSILDLEPKNLEALKSYANLTLKVNNHFLSATFLQMAETLAKNDPEIIKGKAKLALKCEVHTKKDLLLLANHCFQKPHIQSLKPTPLNLLKPLSDNEEELIDILLDKHQGFCIGEFHCDHAPKDFLVKYMSYLKQKGVKVLFMEQFYNDLQQDLDDFAKGSPLPRGIKKNLDDARHQYGYLEVIEAAKENQIRVIAIDTHAAKIEDLPERLITMNYFAFKIMKKTIQELNSTDKYISLMGAGHLSRRPLRGVMQGVAELIQSPRVVILDRKTAKDLRIYESKKIFEAKSIPDVMGKSEIDVIVQE